MIEEKSSSYDLVTNIDRECEAQITKAINETYPDHEIVGEETATDEEIEAISAMVRSRLWLCCFALLDTLPLVFFFREPELPQL